MIFNQRGLGLMIFTPGSIILNVSNSQSMWGNDFLDSLNFKKY